MDKSASEHNNTSKKFIDKQLWLKKLEYEINKTGFKKPHVAKISLA